MSNLLTTNEKDIVVKEYRLRLAVVSTSALGVLMIIGVISLFPSYVLSNSKYKIIENELSIITEQIEKEALGDPEEIIADTNNKLTILEANSGLGINAYEVIRELTERTNLDIHIKDIFYNNNNKDNIKLSINGISNDRGGLLAFVRGLEDSAMFSDIDLPISNFVKDKDIDFSITITINSESEN